VLRALVPNYSLVIISTSFDLRLASDAPNSARSHHGRSPSRADFASRNVDANALHDNKDEHWLVHHARPVLAFSPPSMSRICPCTAASDPLRLFAKLARSLFLPISGSTYEFLHYQRAHDHLRPYSATNARYTYPPCLPLDTVSSCLVSFASHAAGTAVHALPARNSPPCSCSGASPSETPICRGVSRLHLALRFISRPRRGGVLLAPAVYLDGLDHVRTASQLPALLRLTAVARCLVYRVRSAHASLAGCGG
jgi:hypothetical protein